MEFQELVKLNPYCRIGGKKSRRPSCVPDENPTSLSASLPYSFIRISSFYIFFVHHLLLFLCLKIFETPEVTCHSSEQTLTFRSSLLCSTTISRVYSLFTFPRLLLFSFISSIICVYLIHSIFLRLVRTFFYSLSFIRTCFSSLLLVSSALCSPHSFDRYHSPSYAFTFSIF